MDLKKYFIFCLIYGFIDSLEDTDDHDWKSMADGFNNIMSSNDGLQMAKMVSKNLAGFVKIAMKIGGLFATALSLGPDSQEQKAIDKLRIEMKKGFDKTYKNLNYGVHGIALTILYDSYKRDIFDPMRHFQRELDFMMTAANKINETTTDFINNYCKVRQYSPISLLNRLRWRIDGCSEIQSTNEVDALMVEWRILIRKMAMQYMETEKHSSLIQSCHDCSEDIFTRLSTMNIYDSKTALRQVEQTILNDACHKSFRSACDSVRAHLDRYAMESPGCILEIILLAREYRHQPLHEFASSITSAVITLNTYETFCNNIAYVDNPDMADFVEKRMFNDSQIITKLLLDWIPRNLNRAWPAFESQIVQDVIALDQHKLFTVGHYNRLNEKIHANLSMYGPKVYEKQIVTSLANRLYNFKVDGNNTFAVYDQKDTHIVVTRFNATNYEDAVDAENWIKNTTEMIKSSVQRHRHTLLSDLDTFFYREAHQHLLQEGKYGNMVIMRDTGLFFCNLDDYRIKGHVDENINAFFDMYMYFADGIGCVLFRFLFFL